MDRKNGASTEATNARDGQKNPPMHEFKWIPSSKEQLGAKNDVQAVAANVQNRKKRWHMHSNGSRKTSLDRKTANDLSQRGYGVKCVGKAIQDNCGAGGHSPESILSCQPISFRSKSKPISHFMKTLNVAKKQLHEDQVASKITNRIDRLTA